MGDARGESVSAPSDEVEDEDEDEEFDEGWSRVGMGIYGTEGMSDEDLASELEAGGRFVVFDYCISVLVLTFKRSCKSIYFIRAGEVAALKGLHWTALSMVAGWWGFPWGFIYTPAAIIKNLGGGRDVTQPVVAALGLRVRRRR